MAEDVFGIVGTTQAAAFRVDEVVAEGGFAVIYRAYHGAFRSSVALKCLKVPRTLSDVEQKEFLERFREEAELLFRLSSSTPSVVRPLHVGTLSTKERRFVPFIALEWLEGETLDRFISRRVLAGEPPVTLRAAVKLLTPVADALCRAHNFPVANGRTVSIVHRDLKPENIFIANLHGREVAKVLDFGIAKVKAVTTEMVGRQSAAESTMSAFTPAYGAPEQWLPKRYGQTGPWTDVWGLAITLVETLTGRCPIEGDHVAMMGSAIDPERRPTPRNEGVNIPEDVEAVFAQALAVDPRDRFHEVAAFWNALCRASGLPEIAVDVGPSIPPPATTKVSGGAATEIVRGPAGAVPDLVLGDPRPSAREPRGGAVASRGPVSRAPAPGPASPPTAAKAKGPDPNALFGHSFDFDDDEVGGHSHRIELGTARVRQGGVALDGPGAARARAPGGGGAAAPPYLHVSSSARRMGLGPPLKLVGLAVALMAGDWAYANFTGEILRVGPARMIWLAGPILALGVIKLLQGFLAAGD